jgi:hypothetical protein
MPRQIEFAGSPRDCALLLDRLGRHPGIARISLQVGASRKPEGDILTLEAANQTGCEIVNLLDELRLLERGAVRIGEPNATIRAEAVARRGRQRRGLGGDRRDDAPGHQPVVQLRRADGARRRRRRLRHHLGHDPRRRRVACVLVAGGAILALKRALLHRRHPRRG